MSDITYMVSLIQPARFSQLAQMSLQSHQTQVPFMVELRSQSPELILVQYSQTILFKLVQWEVLEALIASYHLSLRLKLNAEWDQQHRLLVLLASWLLSSRLLKRQHAYLQLHVLGTILTVFLKSSTWVQAITLLPITGK